MKILKVIGCLMALLVSDVYSYTADDVEQELFSANGTVLFRDTIRTSAKKADSLKALPYEYRVTYPVTGPIVHLSMMCAGLKLGYEQRIFDFFSLSAGVVANGVFVPIFRLGDQMLYLSTNFYMFNFWYFSINCYYIPFYQVYSHYYDVPFPSIQTGINLYINKKINLKLGLDVTPGDFGIFPFPEMGFQYKL
ncbi:MAG: hypothetical protein NT007_15995 [Candidatus Kapabacteria bacterium]|nr:hypothetical protein [Candidatus Kapabacteria bacterium]